METELNESEMYARQMVEKARQVKVYAQSKDFDCWRVPGKYFILCDWYLDVVRMFDDTESGYNKAFLWVDEQKPEAAK